MFVRCYRHSIKFNYYASSAERDSGQTCSNVKKKSGVKRRLISPERTPGLWNDEMKCIQSLPYFSLQSLGNYLHCSPMNAEDYTVLLSPFHTAVPHQREPPPFIRGKKGLKYIKCNSKGYRRAAPMLLRTHKQSAKWFNPITITEKCNNNF